MPSINHADIQLFYEVVGDGIPIILHYGSGNSIPDWFDLGYVQALQDQYQLIMFDARGHGKSDKPHDMASYSPFAFASDSIAVLDAVGIDQAYCYGYSMEG